MMAQASIDSGYTDYWEEFKIRTDEKEKTIAFLTKFEKCNLTEVTSMLSIGAGEADIDFEMIKCSCPNLTHYTALEPRLDACQKIEEKFQELPHVKVETIQKIIQEFEGPSNPVDFVFICNASYHFREVYEDQMIRALSWLTPEGFLMDIRDNIEDFSFRKTLKEMAAPSRHSMSSLQKGFLNWCLTNGWEVEGDVTEKDYNIDYSFDVSEPGLEQVLQLLLATSLNKEELENAKAVINSSVIKGTTRVPGKQLVVIIRKEKPSAQDGDTVAMATETTPDDVISESNTSDSAMATD